MKVKICGITNNEDAQKAAYYGAWAVGFIFYKKSPRYVSPSKARKIIEALPPFVTPVGVFVNLRERAVKDICSFTRIKTLQFHGDEDPAFCTRFRDCKVIKAFHVGGDFDFKQVSNYRVDAYLFDTYQEKLFGGSGKTFNWEVLKKQKFDKPYILSGGLNPENIKQALSEMNPFAVDASSGLEKSPGIKDPRRIRAFMDLITSPTW